MKKCLASLLSAFLCLNSFMVPVKAEEAEKPAESEITESFSLETSEEKKDEMIIDSDGSEEETDRPDAGLREQENPEDGAEDETEAPDDRGSESLSGLERETMTRYHPLTELR